MNEDRTERTVIVGGGVIGLATAYFLSRWGYAVTVVERGLAGREASFAAAGMRAVGGESEQPDPFFTLCQAGKALYSRLAARLHEQTGVDIEYCTSGILQVACDAPGVARLKERLAWQRRMGLAASWLSAEEVRRRVPALRADVQGGVWYPDDHQVNNRKLGIALREACLAQGVDLREETEVTGWLTTDDPPSPAAKAAGERRVRGVVTPGDEIPARWTILTAGAWSGALAARLGLQLPVRPVKGQIVECRVRTPFPHIVFADGTCYLVPKPGGRLLIGATQEEAGFDRRTTLGAAARLAAEALALAPGLDGAEWVDAWAGLRPGTPDGWPILGPAPGWDGLLMATGHFRNGILLAPITGLMTAQLIAGRPLAINWRPFRLGRFGGQGTGAGVRDEGSDAGRPDPFSSGRPPAGTGPAVTAAGAADPIRTEIESTAHV